MAISSGAVHQQRTVVRREQTHTRRERVPWNALGGDKERARWLRGITAAEQQVEWIKCQKSPAYFVNEYVSIYDKVEKRWIAFRLWQMQRWVLADLHRYRSNVALKARQEGLSWLALAYNGLYKMLFHPMAKVGIFSKRDDEAVYMLGDERLKGMYTRLPPFLQARAIVKSDGHSLTLSNGSVARAFPTTGGDAYAMTDIILDEFDLVPDQNALMRAVKPTIDGGGSMTIVSRVDKDRPQTEFKRLYRGASTKVVISRDPDLTGTLQNSVLKQTCQVSEGNGWNAVFVPWYAHPGRDEAWYAAEKAETFDRTGSLDDLWEQYPATEEEALAARTLNKRVAPAWLKRCYARLEPGAPSEGAPAVAGLEIFRGPEAGRRYVVGADPAEGNPTSDDSAIEVLDRESGEEMCALAGKFEPSTLGYYAHRLAMWYNNAPIMVERNNHGHAVLLWLRDNSHLKVLPGEDRRPGWLDTTRGKAALYDHGAECFRDGRTVVHSEKTYDQIASIEGSTLKAPEGEHDDRAVAYMLGLVALRQPGERKTARSYQG